DISLNMQTAAEGVASVGRNLDNWIVGMEERRFDERIRVVKPGRIIAGAGKPLECSVRDISAGGAKLVLADTGAVPDRFQLQVDGST
ncbi:PilZ domain-containing protein, partial [Klebsiella michiganensis]|uniref:PilZ domain-containing protein n=1 Tax=Klebsiella michiganensis TaxID=1134687 RepID=UPI0013D4CFEF